MCHLPQPTVPRACPRAISFWSESRGSWDSSETLSHQNGVRGLICLFYWKKTKICPLSTPVFTGQGYVVENRLRQDLTLQHSPPASHNPGVNPAASDAPASRPQGWMHSLISGEHSGKGIAWPRGQNEWRSPQPSAGLRLLAPQERRSQDSGFPSPVPSAKKQPTSDSLAIARINEAVIWAGTRGITAEQIKTELELRTAEVFILCIPSKNKPNLLTQVD